MNEITRKGREGKTERDRYGKGSVSIFSVFLSILVFLMAPFFLTLPLAPGSYTYTRAHTIINGCSANPTLASLPYPFLFICSGIFQASRFSTSRLLLSPGPLT